MRRLRRGAFGLVLVAIIFCAEIGPAGAAPMVRRVIGSCTLEAPGEHAATLQALADDVQSILPRIEAELGVRPAAPYRILLIPPGVVSDPEIAAIDAAAPRWAAGFVLPQLRIGAIRMARAGHYPYGDLAAVFTHEATHILLRDAVGSNLPRWFNEGVATGVERAWGLRDIFVFSSSLLTTPTKHRLQSTWSMRRGCSWSAGEKNRTRRGWTK